MVRKNKYPAEIKERVVKEYLKGIKSAVEVADELSINYRIILSGQKNINPMVLKHS